MQLNASTTKFLTIVILVSFLGACTGLKQRASDKKAPAPAPQVVSQPAPVVEEKPVIIMDMGPSAGTQEHLNANAGDRVLFAYDSSELSAAARATLQAQAKWLGENNVNVTMQGHADERGTREYNLALGERRAAAAKNYLVALGVSPSRVTIISYGKERPVALGSNERAWAQNRRAVLVVN